MADGAYERRGPREAELKRLQRIIEERREARRFASAASEPPSPRPTNQGAGTAKI